MNAEFDERGETDDIPLHDSQAAQAPEVPHYPRFIAERRCARMGPALPTARELYTGLAVVMLCAAVVMVRGGPERGMAQSNGQANGQANTQSNRRPAAYPIHEGAQAPAQQQGQWSFPQSSAQQPFMRQPSDQQPYVPQPSLPYQPYGQQPDGTSAPGSQLQPESDLPLAPAGTITRFRQGVQPAPQQREH